MRSRVSNQLLADPLPTPANRWPARRLPSARFGNWSEMKFRQLNRSVHGAEPRGRGLERQESRDTVFAECDHQPRLGLCKGQPAVDNVVTFPIAVL
jgi:hypothetical protein